MGEPEVDGEASTALFGPPVGVGAREYAHQRRLAVIGVASMRGGKKTAARWAHGAYGLWSGAEDSGTWPRERAQQSLQNWYGIGDRSALMKYVEGLKRGGATTASWDMVRGVDMLRMGFASGYLDEDDCWEAVRQIALVRLAGRQLPSSVAAFAEHVQRAWVASA